MSRKGWIWIIVGVLVVAGLMVALALGVHWLLIALMAGFTIAWIGVMAGFGATLSFIERLIWPRGVFHRKTNHQTPANQPFSGRACSPRAAIPSPAGENQPTLRPP